MPYQTPPQFPTKSVVNNFAPPQYSCNGISSVDCKQSNYLKGSNSGLYSIPSPSPVVTPSYLPSFVTESPILLNPPGKDKVNSSRVDQYRSESERRRSRSPILLDIPYRFNVIDPITGRTIPLR